MLEDLVGALAMAYYFLMLLGLLGILGLVSVVLKLFGVISWPWWLTMSPFWLAGAVFCAISVWRMLR